MPMTTLKRRLATTFSSFVADPLAKLVAGAHLPGVPALLETTGRKSGKPRHVVLTQEGRDFVASEAREPPDRVPRDTRPPRRGD